MSTAKKIKYLRKGSTLISGSKRQCDHLYSAPQYVIVNSQQHNNGVKLWLSQFFFAEYKFTQSKQVRMTSLNAQEIQEQLVSLREDARTRSPGELSRVENVAQEFFQVKIFHIDFRIACISLLTSILAPCSSQLGDSRCCCWLWNRLCSVANWGIFQH